MSVKGFGTTFQYTTDGGTSWTNVGEVINPTPPAPSKEVYDTTHHGSASGTRTKEGSLVDPGQASVEVLFDPENTGHQLLMTRANTAHESPQTYRITQADAGATIIEFTAICVGYTPVIPMDDKLTQTFTFEVSGVIDNDATL